MLNGVAAGIRVIMAQKGLVQKHVAERAGFSAQQFTDMVCGRKIIRADYLPRIADALGVSIAELLDAWQSSA